MPASIFFSLAWLFLSLSLFVTMELGQSLSFSSSQAEAFFGLPTSRSLGEGLQPV